MGYQIKNGISDKKWDTVYIQNWDTGAILTRTLTDFVSKSLQHGKMIISSFQDCLVNVD